MTFQFRPGVRERVSLLIGLAGASGSGKTYSALQLATGLAGPKGKIAVIDTEAGRALHYADQFKFDHGDLSAPFRPERYQEAILAADKAGYDVIVIDSMSHEYEGEGGLLDWAAQLEAAGTKSPGNWKLPKTAHKRMMGRLLQMRAHLIFCMRADEKIKIDRDPQSGKTVIIPLGWMPICEKRFMYELTASFTLSPETPGRPRFDLPHKLQEQHRPAFPEGRPIGREAGATLATWARGGAAPRERLNAAPPEEASVADDDQPAPEVDIGALGLKLARWVEKYGADPDKLAASPKYRDAYRALVSAGGHPDPAWPEPKGE